MLANDLGFRQSGPPGRSGPETLFPPAPGTYRSRFDGMPTTVRRTNFSGPGFSGGTASFTIVSGPGGRLEGPGGMDFNSYALSPMPPSRGSRRVAIVIASNSPNSLDRVFANLMATVVPPPGGVRAGGDPTGVPPAQRAFPPSLQQLLSALLNPANAIHGDAVYSQEALDRIITSLMEANPQSNAAPPASQSAIENLQRKPLDDEMLGPEGRAECIICIDNMNKGDLVVVLPCKHWFHEECVVLWLKEHNTCPICRQAIEGNGTARGDNNNNAPQQQPQQPRQPQPPRPPYTSPYESQGPSRPPFTSPYEPQGPPRPPFTSPYESQGSSRPGQPAHRSHSQNEARLAAIRAAGGRDQHGGGQMRRASLSPPSPFQQRSRSGSEPRDPEQERPYDNPYQSPYESPYSRPRREPYEEHHGGSGRTGQNQGSRRENSTQDQDQGGGGSHNPLSWIRDQFSRHSGGGSGGGRH